MESFMWAAKEENRILYFNRVNAAIANIWYVMFSGSDITILIQAFILQWEKNMKKVREKKEAERHEKVSPFTWCYSVLDH